MDDLYSMLRGIVDSQRDLQERVARLETLEAMLYENNDIFPTVPAPYSGQLHQTSKGIWIFDTGITDGTHPLGRWKSVSPATGRMEVGPAGSANNVLVAPQTTAFQVHFAIISTLYDAFVYGIEHTIFVGTPNTGSSYWVINNDLTGGASIASTDTRLAIAGAVTHYRFPSVNTVVVKSAQLRLIANSVGSSPLPGNFNVFSTEFDYVLLGD